MTDESRLTTNLPPLDPKRALAGDAPAPAASAPYDREEFRTGRGRTVMIGLWVGGAAVALLVLLGLTLGQKPRGGPAERPGPEAGSAESPLATARLALAKQTDADTCRSALQQLGGHLAAPGAPAVPELTPGRAAGLKKAFGLDGPELAEVGSTTFTVLDAYHLEACLLLRDGARSLELAGVGQAPLDRAAAAFDWVVRQVRLVEHSGEAAPPAFVLRRGWGSALERGLVFLALLEQFGQEDEARTGLQGCLLFLPEKGKDLPRLWACGVAVGDAPKDLYLFDPALGMALPGPGGEGVATLAAARQDASVLGQLDAGEKDRYRVTAEQARGAEARLVCPLSALAPRMKVLQDRLLREVRWKGQALPPPVPVRLAEDEEGARRRLGQAAGGGKGELAGVWRPGTGVLRRFLPAPQGGTDKGGRLVLFNQQLASLADFPPRFREFVEAGTGLGPRLLQTFAGPALHFATGPGQPRDLVLRGRFEVAAAKLEEQRRSWQRLRDRPKDPNMEDAIEEWVDRAFAAYRRLVEARGDEAAKAQVEALWDVRQPVQLYLQLAMADGRLAEVIYQLALCKHEAAQRRQDRLDLARRGGKAALAEQDQKEARDAWEDAEGLWREYLGLVEDFRAKFAPDPAGDAKTVDVSEAAARRMRAHCLARLGQTEKAVEALRAAKAAPAGPEKLANLYRARALEKAGKGE